MHTLVGDDDATVRSNMKHTFKDCAEKEPGFQWPRYKTGPDKGKLGFDVKEVKTFLADPSH
jgi:hypothetical protein